MKIIVGNTQEPWRPVFQDLLDRHGIKPVLMVNPGASEASFLAANPDIIQINWYQVMRGDFSGKLESLADSPFDRHCQRVWTEDALPILDQYNRLDHGRDFSLLERKLHLYQQIIFWNGVFEHLRPDAVLFPFLPHVVTDNVILALAKSRGIPSVQGDYILEAGKWVFHSSADWAGFTAEASVISRLDDQAGLKIENDDLQEWHAELLTRLTEGRTAYSHISYSGQNFQWQRQASKMEAWKFWAKEIQMLVRGAWNSLGDLFAGRGFCWCGQKERGRRFGSSYAGRFGRFRFHWGNFRAKRHARALKNAYSRLARANEGFRPDGATKYVFFALHYQPESSTNPLGGIYTDMYLAANLLRHSLPPGWELLIKEHPGQFYTDVEDLVPYQGHIPRSRDYYEALTAGGRVKLIPLDYPSPLLVEHCSAIATITGSIGVEASARGKPVLCFGDAFYLPVKGIFRIRTLEDCQEALRMIDQGSVASLDSLRRHLSEMEFHQCEITGKYIPVDQSWLAGGRGFADAIASALNRAQGRAESIHLHGLFD